MLVPPTAYDPRALLQYLPSPQPLLLSERMAALSTSGSAGGGNAGRKRQRPGGIPGEPSEEERLNAEVRKRLYRAWASEPPCCGACKLGSVYILMHAEFKSSLYCNRWPAS